MKKNIAGLLCLFCLALLAGCGSKGGDGPPPDLTGRWRQVMDGGTPTFYQVAEIEGDRIRTWWHLSEDDSEYLYWIGTFVPPENDAEPYSCMVLSLRSMAGSIYGAMKVHFTMRAR